MRRLVLFTFLLVTAGTLSWAAEGLPAEASAQSGDLLSPLVQEDLTLSPDDPHWKTAPVKTLVLMPQTVTVPKGGGAVKQLKTQALTTSEALYLRLEWADPTQDTLLGPPETFSDACAIQVPLSAEPLPSAFMGAAGQPVSIWFWKAVWQKPHEATPATVDLYPEGDWTAGQSAGNPQSLIERPSAAEHLLAEGYGTLTAAPLEGLEAQGRWSEGRWVVVFRRGLASPDPEKSPTLKAGQRVPVAFAVWDGVSKERGALKSVTLNWNWLALAGERTGE